MKRTLIALVCVFSLSACGAQNSDSDSDSAYLDQPVSQQSATQSVSNITNEEKQLLIRNCTDDGEAEETCECIVTSMEEKLSPTLFGKLADTVKSGSNPEDLMSSLSPEEQTEFLGLVPDMMQCAQ